MVASLALETALDTAIQGRQQQATAATGATNGPDSGEQGSGAVVRNLAQELELIFKRDTGNYYIDTSVVDPGCLSRIRIFSIPDPGSEFFFLDPHQRI
jgi:hypothetical protein